jgi:hypothetical protein
VLCSSYGIPRSLISDNIESHVESAGSHVEDANVQLAKASDYQVSDIVNKGAVIIYWRQRSLFMTGGEVIIYDGGKRVG